MSSVAAPPFRDAGAIFGEVQLDATNVRRTNHRAAIAECRSAAPRFTCEREWDNPYSTDAGVAGSRPDQKWIK